MLKFFRNIRRSLLSDNKTGKYLKYSIGEMKIWKEQWLRNIVTLRGRPRFEINRLPS
jgi:hypothetical protein